MKKYTACEEHFTEDEEDADQVRRRTATTRRTESWRRHRTMYYYSTTRSLSTRHNNCNNSCGDHGDKSFYEDDYDDSEYLKGRMEESTPLLQIIPVHSRAIGLPNLDLRSIKPANRIFDKPMSYRSYRLKRTMDTCLSLVTAEIRVRIQNLNLIMKSKIFDGVDPIRVFNFLTRFVNEADAFRMP